MTLQEARDAAAVMIAFAEGEKIEFRNRQNPDLVWSECPSPVWQWAALDYRVAAEPWQGKIWVHPEGETAVYRNGHSLEGWEKAGYRLITAKEVQDD